MPSPSLALSEGTIASSSTFCRAESLQPWHQESHRRALLTLPPPPGARPSPNLPGRDMVGALVAAFGCTEPPGSGGCSLRGFWGPGRCPPAPAAEAQALGSGGAALPEKGRCQQNNERSTTHSQRRNYSRHKENTNKDQTRQRQAGISQHKRRIETLKAAFISLYSSVHGQSNSRNVRAWGTAQVTRISSFTACFLYKLTPNTGVLVLFALFGSSETEWDPFSASPLKGCSNEQRMEFTSLRGRLLELLLNTHIRATLPPLLLTIQRLHSGEREEGRAEGHCQSTDSSSPGWEQPLCTQGLALGLGLSPGAGRALCRDCHRHCHMDTSPWQGIELL